MKGSSEDQNFQTMKLQRLKKKKKKKKKKKEERRRK